MQTSDKIRVAVIGAGNISGVHFKNLAALPEVELVGVCDVAPGRAASVTSQRGGRPYTDFVQMLDAEKPQAVLLLTPQTVRLEPIRACAERGIPVFLEKPPARNLEEARQCAALLRQRNLIHSVGFCLRYKDVVRKSAELLRGRRIHLVRMRYYAPMILQYEKFPPFYFLQEVSGGVLVDQALHFVDLARYLVGDDIREVHGFGSNLYRPRSKEITTAENIVLNFRFRAGTVGSHTHTWAYASWTGEIELVSPQARLLLDVFHDRLTGTVDEVNVEYASSSDGYLRELEGFLHAVRTGDRSRILSDYDDAVKTLGVCLAANRSLDTGAVEAVEPG